MNETVIVPGSAGKTGCPGLRLPVPISRRRTIVAAISILVIGFTLVWTTASRGATDRPAQFMRTVAKQLVSASRSGSPHILAGVIRRYADVPDIGLYSLGSYMKSLPKARRPSYYDGVARFMARYFMAQAKSYPVAKIDIFAPSKPADWGYKVDSRISLTNGDTYTIRWLVVRRGQSFKVRDVSILGFWMTPFQRKLFEGYIDDKGGNVHALLAVLGG